MKFYKMLILSLYMKQCSVYSIIVKKEQLKIHIQVYNLQTMTAIKKPKITKSLKNKTETKIDKIVK